MSRRDLIQRVLLGGTVLVLAPSILESCTKNPATDPNAVIKDKKLTLDLTLSENSSLNTTGASMILQNLIIINTGGGKFSALSSICTHQGCTVGYDSPTGNIKCPCHGSVFSTSGSVVNGPAQSALQSYPASLTGNILTISL
jgi:cytochrome b6-f complex iron-sulfur subunit